MLENSKKVFFSNNWYINHLHIKILYTITVINYISNLHCNRNSTNKKYFVWCMKRKTINFNVGCFTRFFLTKFHPFSSSSGSCWWCLSVICIYLLRNELKLCSNDDVLKFNRAFHDIKSAKYKIDLILWKLPIDSLKNWPTWKQLK